MTRRDRFRFFLEHAGYRTPPGRAVCALELARAEELADEAEAEEIAEWLWEYDPLPWDEGTEISAEEARRKFESNEWTGPFVGFWKIAGEISSSIGGVVLGPEETGDPYARVLRAELAGELEAELRQALGDARDAEQLEELDEAIARSWGDTRKGYEEMRARIAETL